MNGEIIQNANQDYREGNMASSRGRQPAASAAFRLDLRRAFSMHAKLSIFAALTVFALTILYGLTRPRRYESEVIFYVAPVQQEVLHPAGTQLGFDSARYEATIQQLMQTLQRQDVAEVAIRSLPEGVWRIKGEPVSNAASRLISGLTVQRAGSGFQLSADLQGSTPEDATAALNALSKAFLAQVKLEESGSVDQQLSLLREEQEHVQEAIASNRQQQADLSASIGVSRLSTDENNPIDSAVADLRREIFDVKRLGMGSSSSGEDMRSAGDGDSGSSTTSGLITQLNARKAQLQSQMAGMTAVNPIRQQDQAELAATERELAAASERAEVERREHDAQRQAQMKKRADAAEAQLRTELAKQTEAVAKAAPQIQQYAQLGSDINHLQIRSDSIDEAIRGLNLNRHSPGTVRVVVPPSIPLEPLPGKRKLLLLASLPLGILAGIFAAAFAHKRDGRIFLSDDVEQVLGFHPMATLPAQADVSDQVREAYLLRLASSVENSYRNANTRTFVFTAPSVATDVEHLVFQVQTKLRELGYSALWIDSDTLLRSERDFEDAYNRGPAMEAHARTNEKGIDGLAEARLSWLKRDYDMVLVDAPPLTISGEAEYAVRRCDATILVNESGVTTRDELQNAGEILERIGLGGVGVVITDLHLADADLLFRNSIRLAEADLARRVPHGPRDEEGAWTLFEPGTDRELMLPGDPVARIRRGRRPDHAAKVRYTSV